MSHCSKALLGAALVLIVGMTAVSAADAITREKAQEIALSQAGGGRVIGFDRHLGAKGRHFFRFAIINDEGVYNIEIDEQTGRLQHLSRASGVTETTVAVAAPPASAQTPVSAREITREEAQAIALKQTGGGTIIESDVDHKHHGRIFYEFEIVNDGVRYELEIDAADGSVAEFKQKQTMAGAAARYQPKLTMEAAQQLAREKAGGGQIVKYELDHDRGLLVHEIVVFRNNVLHRVEINDADGQVLKYKVK